MVSISQEASAVIDNNKNDETVPANIQTRIFNWNLTHVQQRLVNVQCWSIAAAKEAIHQYRRFIFLKKKYPGISLPPSYEVDEVWHAHILHTQDYQRFCSDIFEQYLHHNPHLTDGASSLAELNQLFLQTQALYYQEFGDYLYAIKTHMPRSTKLLNGIKSIFQPNKKEYRHETT